VHQADAARATSWEKSPHGLAGKSAMAQLQALSDWVHEKLAMQGINIGFDDVKYLETGRFRFVCYSTCAQVETQPSAISAPDAMRQASRMFQDAARDLIPIVKGESPAGSKGSRESSPAEDDGDEAFLSSMKRAGGGKRLAAF